MKTEIIGTGVALITPFTKEGNVDFSGLENVVTHAINCGVNYLVLMGTTAEAVTLSKKEKDDVISTIKKVNAGRLPLVLGLGGNNTAAVIEQIQQTDLSDYTAILSVAPAYNKPTQTGIYAHFEAIANATDTDIILYNVPGRTSCNIDSSTTLKLAYNFKNIVAIKEASPNYVQSTEVIKDKPSDFLVLSGDDEYGLPMTLAGGSGVISVIGQAIPQYAKMIQLGLERKVDEAYQIHYQIMELTRSIYKEGNPAGVKALFEAQNICEKHTRLPLVSASQELAETIKNLHEKTLEIH